MVWQISEHCFREASDNIIMNINEEYIIQMRYISFDEICIKVIIMVVLVRLCYLDCLAYGILEQYTFIFSWMFNDIQVTGTHSHTDMQIYIHKERAHTEIILIFFFTFNV